MADETPLPLNPAPQGRAQADRPVRYGVMGAGLIGTYLGGLLALAGRDVTLVGRGAVQGAIAKNGLVLSDYTGRQRAADGFVFATQPAMLARCDVVLITVKSPATEAAARALAPHIDSAALVVSFQNGVRNAARLEAALPGNRVLPGLVPFNVASPAPGRFHKGTQGALWMRSAGGLRVQDMVAAFIEAEQSFEMEHPFHPLLWGKLLMNLNNPLNALHGGGLRAGLMQGAYRRVLAQLVVEGLRAVEADGIAPKTPAGLGPHALPWVLRLPTPLFALVMHLRLRIDARARSSMLEDLERGRESENPWLQGEIIRLGRRHGVDVETHRRVAEAVEAAFATGESPRLSGRQMVRRFLRG